MQKLWLGALACCGIVIALCYAAIFIGYRLPEGQFIPEIGYCGKSICYLGIIPDVTPWDHSIAVLKQNPQLEMVDNSDNRFLNSELNYSFALVKGSLTRSQFLTIIEMDLLLGRSNIVVGEGIKRLGPPCFIAASSVGMTVGYPSAILVVRSNSHWLSVTTPIHHIVLRNAKEPCPKENQTSPLTIYAWRGFGNYPEIHP